MAEHIECDLGTSYGSSSLSDTQQKPIKIELINFSFELSPASKLKGAILALSDKKFNKQGTGMIEVEGRAIKITVHNDEYDVLGCLTLNSGGLMDVGVENPLKRKMIDLKEVLKNLDGVGDDCAVTVYHVDGANELCFESEAPDIKFGVELHEVECQFQEFPSTKVASECFIHTPGLWALLDLLEATQTKLASFEISDSWERFFVGQDEIKLEYEAEKMFVTRGPEKGKSHQSSFMWPHCKALRKSSSLASGTILCFLTEPEESVMFRFNLRNLGDLMFLKKAVVLDLDFGLPTESEADDESVNSSPEW